MDIAVDVRSLMEGRVSGVEIYTTELIRALIRGAPQHTWHLFYNSFVEVPLPSFGPNCTLHGFHYPNKVFNSLQWSLGLPRWDTLVPADIFFLPNMRLLPLRPGAPYVVTAHDLSFAHFPEFYSLRRRLWHRLMRPGTLMQQASHVIAVSQITADDVATIYDVPRSRISVVHSGVQVPVVRKKQRPLVVPERYILYLGTLEPRKNVPSIIEAFSALADRIPHDLVIAGAPGWLMKDIQRALRASSARYRIHVLGPVAEEDKDELYRRADLFVYPSFYEGFGFPPLEALLAGTPVITSHNSALPEVVGEWATLIDPYNPTELALVMLEHVQDPVTVPPGVQEAVRSTYSWDRAAEETLAVIERAAEVPYA